MTVSVLDGSATRRAPIGRCGGFKDKLEALVNGQFIGDTQAVEPTPELIDELWREEVLDARRLPLETKLVLGAQLFDYACTITRAGIRHQFPDADENRVLEILRQRLAWAEKREQSL